MQRRLIILLLICTLLSCEKSNAPDILPKEKMEKVLWDVAQSTEYLNAFVYSRKPELNRVAVNDVMLKRIFKIHKITKQQFTKSMEYYRNNPKNLITILDSIVAKQKRIAADTLSITTPKTNDVETPNKITQ